jgi:hypothetical protein
MCKSVSFERHLILNCRGGKWSAAYSDRPDEKVYGATLQEAIERLKATYGTGEVIPDTETHQSPPEQAAD